MAKSPSKKTHRIKPAEGLNLTPFIDMITCLMFFLMMFAGIIPVVIIDAPLPKVASTAEEVKQAKNAENKLDVTVYITANGFSVKLDGGKDHSVGKTADGKYAHSACIGFGLERIALALFKTHGFDPDQWPSSVKNVLGL